MIPAADTRPSRGCATLTLASYSFVDLSACEPLADSGNPAGHGFLVGGNEAPPITRPVLRRRIASRYTSARSPSDSRGFSSPSLLPPTSWWLLATASVSTRLVLPNNSSGLAASRSKKIGCRSLVPAGTCLGNNIPLGSPNSYVVEITTSSSDLSDRYGPLSAGTRPSRYGKGRKCALLPSGMRLPNTERASQGAPLCSSLHNASAKLGNACNQRRELVQQVGPMSRRSPRDSPSSPRGVALGHPNSPYRGCVATRARHGY